MMAFKIAKIFIAALLLLTLGGCRQIQEKLDKYLLEAQYKWGFEGVALLAVDGKVIFSRGYGMANLEMGEPNTPQTKFYIGSITKQFTAAAIMLLYQDKPLDIHDPISKYLPDYTGPGGDKITIHHLLTHSSGIPNYTNDPSILQKLTDQITPEQLMLAFADKPLEFEPGTKFSYSNSGYIVLGAIIEKLSGQSYEAFLHRRIFKPLGMTNTGYARREAAVPNRADGYTLAGRGRLARAVPIDFSILHTAGALYSTAPDMLKWDQALYTDEILKQEYINMMITSQIDSYGYGWFIDDRFGKTHTYHGGFIDGFNTTFERWLDDHLCIIVFSNEDEAPVKKIAQGMAAIVYGYDYEMPIRKTPLVVDTSVLNEYTGVYNSGENIYHHIELIDGELYISLYDNLMYHLYAEATDKFYFANDNTETISFKRNDLGHIVSFIYESESTSLSADKLSGK